MGLIERKPLLTHFIGTSPLFWTQNIPIRRTRKTQYSFLSHVTSTRYLQLCSVWVSLSEYRWPITVSDLHVISGQQAYKFSVPFVLTMAVAFAISSYMLFDPAPWLEDVMELTYMSVSFRVFVLVLAIGGFAVSYAAERLLLPRIAKWIAQARAKLRPEHQKKRKEYKLVLEAMRI